MGARTLHGAAVLHAALRRRYGFRRSNRPGDRRTDLDQRRPAEREIRRIPQFRRTRTRLFEFQPAVGRLQQCTGQRKRQRLCEPFGRTQLLVRPLLAAQPRNVRFRTVRRLHVQSVHLQHARTDRSGRFPAARRGTGRQPGPAHRQQHDQRQHDRLLRPDLSVGRRRPGDAQRRLHTT